MCVSNAQRTVLKGYHTVEPHHIEYSVFNLLCAVTMVSIKWFWSSVKLRTDNANIENELETVAYNVRLLYILLKLSIKFSI